MNVQQSIMRLPTIIDTYGVSRAFIYKQIAEGLFPSQVSLGPRTVGWLKSEVDCVMLARVNGYSNDKVATLVSRLHSERETMLQNSLSAMTDVES